MLTPQQQQLFSSTLEQLGPGFASSFGSFLQPRGEEDYQETFSKTFEQPALQTFQQKIAPAIQQRFTDVNAGSSSALNQALAQSASDLSTSIGSQFGQFMQGQQGQQLNALGAFLPLLTGQTFSPMMQQQRGILGPLLQAAGMFGSQSIMSSRNVKENIREYEKGLDEVRKLNVKKYDYIEDVGGQKNKVGLIAEEVPSELTSFKGGILHVDLYGVMGLMINAIKDLEKKLDELKGAD